MLAKDFSDGRWELETPSGRQLGDDFGGGVDVHVFDVASVSSPRSQHAECCLLGAGTLHRQDDMDECFEGILRPFRTCVDN
jgi:hypothetical protein